MKNLRIFLDSNILLAGLASTKGGSAEILRLAEAKAFQIVISNLVVKEAERNFKKKLPEFLPLFYFVLKHLNLEIYQDIRKIDKKLAKFFVKESDQIIFETASYLQPDYFITLNRKHFHQSKIKQMARFKIMIPAEFLKEWRNIY
jgi:predicted nucleic acid-binding protein